MKSKYSKTTRQLLDEIRQNQLDETITAVKNKAKKTGMPYGILKKVYDRGMAAWKGGHRPGATQIQWALARVNSFVTKSSGTWGGADKDLAKKVRATEGFDPECPICNGGECQCATPEVGRVCEDCGGEECVCSSLEESKMSEIDRMSKGGKSAEEIAKALKLDVKAVKSVLGEARQLKDKDKETMVHKGGKVIVIDKSDLKKYKAKGYEMAEKMKHISFDKARPQLPPHLKKLFDKDGNFINPKSQAVFDKMVKDAGGFDGLRKKYNIEEKDLPEACWTGFKQVGMKKKGDKMVPNCVPTEDLDAQPQDKDVKKVKGTQPKKYYKDLKKDTKKKRADFFKKRPDYKKSDDDDDYKSAPGDKTAKTKPSTFTKKFKKMYGEEVLNEFTAAQIKTLEKEYAPLKGKRMSPDQLNKMMGMIKRMSKDQLNKLAQASIPFVTSTAKSELVINRGMKWTDFKESLKIEDADAEPSTPIKKKKGEDKDATIDRLEKENQLLKVRNLEKSQKTVEPNRDTGEVPLKVGLAQKILKDMKDGKKVEIPKKNKKEIKLDKKPTKVETKPTMDISPSAGGDTQAPSN